MIIRNRDHKKWKEEASTVIFPLPMFNNCLENTFTHSYIRNLFVYLCNATRIFVGSLRIFTYIYKFDDFTQMLFSSAAIDLEMTGSFWRQSPASRRQNHRTPNDVLHKSPNVRSRVSYAHLCAIVLVQKLFFDIVTRRFIYIIFYEFSGT